MMARCGGFGVDLFRHDLRFAQSEDRAARVGEHAVDGAVAGKVIKGCEARGAEHDQAGVALLRQSQNLNRRVAVRDGRFDGGAAFGAGFFNNAAQFVHDG